MQERPKERREREEAASKAGREEAKKERGEERKEREEEDEFKFHPVNWSKITLNPLNVDNAADKARANYGYGAQPSPRRGGSADGNNDYALVGGPLHRGRGDAWSNAVPTPTDETLRPGERSEQMEGFPFVDQQSSPLARWEGSTAASMAGIQRRLDSLREQLERDGGRNATDRAGSKP